MKKITTAVLICMTLLAVTQFVVQQRTNESTTAGKTAVAADGGEGISTPYNLDHDQESAIGVSAIPHSTVIFQKSFDQKHLISINSKTLRSREDESELRASLANSSVIQSLAWSLREVPKTELLDQRYSVIDLLREAIRSASSNAVFAEVSAFFSFVDERALSGDSSAYVKGVLLGDARELFQALFRYQPDQARRLIQNLKSPQLLKVLNDGV